MKTFVQLTSIVFFGVLLSACDPSQTQNEGGSTASGVGSTHSHRMPDGSVKVHTHDGDLSKGHTHTPDEM